MGGGAEICVVRLFRTVCTLYQGGAAALGGDSLTLTHVEGGELGREDVKLKRRIGCKMKQTDVI